MKNKIDKIKQPNIRSSVGEVIGNKSWAKIISETYMPILRGIGSDMILVESRLELLRRVRWYKI